jgi:hypothetical protein
LVVDLLSPDSYVASIPLPVKKQKKWKSILFGWRSKESSAIVANKPPDIVVEELFEEGSAWLADRLVAHTFGLERSFPIKILLFCIVVI